MAHYHDISMFCSQCFSFFIYIFFSSFLLTTTVWVLGHFTIIPYCISTQQISTCFLFLRICRQYHCEFTVFGVYLVREILTQANYKDGFPRDFCLHIEATLPANILDKWHHHTGAQTKSTNGLEMKWI